MAEAPRTSRLAEEIRQTRPFRSARAEMALALMRTAAVLRRRYAKVIEPRGLSLPQYNVLRILRGARGEPLPTLEIGERMIEEAPGVTRLLDRLEAKGLVRRQRCTSDRRLVHCWITDPGLELLTRIDPLLNDADNQVVAHLSDEEQVALIHLLERVREVTG